MSEQRVFFSWQSDVRAAACRTIIERALGDAVKEIADDDSILVEPVIDRDTLGLPGCPDIGEAIFSKVAGAAVFVADVTIINASAAERKTPNPNVLVELGYALGMLGPERVVLVQNTALGRPEDLPFDLRQKRTLTYASPEDAEERAPERKRLQVGLREALVTILHRPRLNKSPTIADQLSEIPAGTTARLVYLPLSREEYVHDKFEVEVLAIDVPGNVLRMKNRVGPSTLDAIPLGDIEQVWWNDGVPFIQVSGFMDHTPMEPYRYRPRPRGRPVPMTSVGPQMSDAAAEMLNHIAALYAKNNPQHRPTWGFKFSEDARMGELRALGLVQTRGTRNRNGEFEWKLTDRGQRWVLAHRPPETSG